MRRLGLIYPVGVMSMLGIKPDGSYQSPFVGDVSMAHDGGPHVGYNNYGKAKQNRN